MTKQRNNKGISLPMVIGLVSLLMIASVASNELIIKALRSAHQIEASDRAYFAAEAGIEDALYELSPHFAGYETPTLPVGSPDEIDDARKDDFGGDLTWVNRWEIKNLSGSTTFGTDEDKNLVFYPNQKLIISLFNDSFFPPPSPAINAINSETAEINHIDLGLFSITFRIPYDSETGYSSAFTDVGGLAIDNDGDGETNGINEDGPGDMNICPGDSHSTEDSDCDGREDEDSEYDPVIYWKIIDDEGRSLTPLRGCIEDGGSEICEKDFVDLTDYFSASLNLSDEGWDDAVQSAVTISAFLEDDYQGRTVGTKVQMEFTIVAPLEQATTIGGFKRYDIPYLEYVVTSDVDNIPLPYFTIRSDGWYKDFKQSITTYVTPKTAVPLFDFTIVQQQ
jgi:hypothetical protein